MTAIFELITPRHYIKGLRFQRGSLEEHLLEISTGTPDMARLKQLGVAGVGAGGVGRPLPCPRKPPRRTRFFGSWVARLLPSALKPRTLISVGSATCIKKQDAFSRSE